MAVEEGQGAAVEAAIPPLRHVGVGAVGGPARVEVEEDVEGRKPNEKKKFPELNFKPRSIKINLDTR